MQNINDGNFWEEILSKEESGEKKFFNGRDIESRDSLKACEYLQESISIYGDIMDLIDEKRPYIVKAKFKYRKAIFLVSYWGLD